MLGPPLDIWPSSKCVRVSPLVQPPLFIALLAPYDSLLGLLKLATRGDSVPRRFFLQGVLFGFLLSSPVTLAWGEDGHYIVADLAWRELTPQARTAVEALLKDDPDKTIVEASTWADRLRKDHRYDWAKPLHYVNLPPDAQGYDAGRDCKDGKCVVGAIDRFIAVLRDPNASVEKRREALKLVTHFVGDVHQPLHVSQARDRGGNDIKVEFFGNNTNLHSVWDGQTLRHTKKAWREYAEELCRGITDEQRKKWAASTPAEWANESWKLALSNAYDVPKDGQLRQAYYDKNLPVVEERLKMAGVRLAAVLNGTYLPPVGGSAATPSDNKADPDVEFVGSKKSDVYHYPNCADLKKIKPENLVKYRSAPQGTRLHRGCPR